MLFDNIKITKKPLSIGEINNSALENKIRKIGEKYSKNIKNIFIVVISYISIPGLLLYIIFVCPKDEKIKLIFLLNIHISNLNKTNKYIFITIII